mmetsp:Transcript_44444/g.111323  ORF Transcript_44444/g.111323 Transcript_44444/m.111323 type:complete len:331 (+) Transcript_44444:396-1388(+)
MDVGRDRVQQHGGQGRRPLLQGEEEAHHHHPDGAQVRPGLVPRPPAGGLRRYIPAGAAERHRRPRGAQGGHPPRHRAVQRHGRQQRDRRHPAHGGDRQDLPREQGLLPLGHCPGRREDRGRREQVAARPCLHLGPQDLWPQGGGRPVHPPEAPRPHGAHHQRRRPGEGAAQRDGARGHGGGDGRRGEDRPGGDGDGPDARQAAGRQDVQEHHRRRPRGVPQRGQGEEVPRQPEPELRLRRGGEPADGAEGGGGVVGERVHLGVARAFVRPPRPQRRRGPRALVDPLRDWALHHRGGGGPRDAAGHQARDEAEGHVAPVGDAPRGGRPQKD